MPTAHPYNLEDGSDLDSEELADLDLAFDADDEDSEDDAASGAAPGFHFVGMAGESGSSESRTLPESILPALQMEADSEAGSVDTAPMEQDPESEGESDDFSRKVASCLGRPVEVLMGNVTDPNDDPNTSKAANGEEKTPQAGNLKMDFVPPLAPLKETDRVPAGDDDIDAKTGEAAEREHERRMASYKQLLTPLPPNASLDDIEKRRALLEEQAAQIVEREVELTNKETEFIRKHREKGADDVFRPARDKNLHKRLDFRSKWGSFSDLLPTKCKVMGNIRSGWQKLR